MKGVRRENFQSVRELIRIYERIAEEGFEPDLIEAGINSVEFDLKTTGAYPRGLLVMLRSLATWLYDQNPLAPVFWGTLAKLKVDWREEKSFETSSVALAGELASYRGHVDAGSRSDTDGRRRAGIDSDALRELRLVRR